MFTLVPGFGSGPAPTTDCVITNGETLVTSCGSVSGPDDSAVVQKANDQIAAAGGGRVIFPAGTYQVWGIQQDSNVEFASQDGPGQTTITRISDNSDTPMIASRIRDTYGAIATGSKTLTVTNAKGIVPGSIVGIRGAGGRSANQRATLLAKIGASDTSITIDRAKDFPASGNYLLIDDEIVSYRGITKTIRGPMVFTGVQRGLFGTAAVMHWQGTYAWQVERFYAKVVSVSGTTLTLDAPAPKGVSNSLVTVGTTGESIRGLTLKGSQSDSASPAVVLYGLAANTTIASNVVTNGDQIGVRLWRGSRDSLIENNQFLHNGTVPTSAGVWLFGGATGNTVRNNTFDEDIAGVVVDDRSQISSEWDESSDNNAITDNVIRIGRSSSYAASNSGVVVEASRRNLVQGNVITGPSPSDLSVAGPLYGIFVDRNDTQGTVSEDSSNNVIQNNTVRRNQRGLNITGSANEFISNQVEAADNQPVMNGGSANYFSSNVCTDLSDQIIDCGTL